MSDGPFNFTRSLGKAPDLPGDVFLSFKDGVWSLRVNQGQFIPTVSFTPEQAQMIAGVITDAYDL